MGDLLEPNESRRKVDEANQSVSVPCCCQSRVLKAGNLGQALDDDEDVVNSAGNVPDRTNS